MKKVTNFQIPFLLLLFFSSLLSAQTTIWQGDDATEPTNWAVGENWSLGIAPTASDIVIIPVVPNDPIILNATLAFAKSVIVQSNGKLTIQSGGILTIEGSTTNGIYNRGTIENLGEINIDDINDHGILNERPGTIFINHGKINIGANMAITRRGIWNWDAYFANETGGEINIDDTLQEGLMNFNTGTIFNNQGKINIGANKAIIKVGLWNGGAANFTNETGGEINIDRSSGAIINGGYAAFTNSAAITIGATASVGNYGIQNFSTFDNNSGGDIQIDRSKEIGLWNDPSGTFTNEAAITIGANDPVGSNGIFNIGTFYNQNGGDIRIDNSTFAGLHISINGTFTNEATITIGANASVGTHGIRNNATFKNKNDGDIHIDLSTDTGLLNTPNGTFTNEAGLTIGANASVGSTGIRNDGTFYNENGGDIHIDNSSLTGLYNAGDTFTNSAAINIGANASVGANALENRSTFKNLSGELKIDRFASSGIYNNGGTLTNEAAITIGADAASLGVYGIYNTSIFDNNPSGDIHIDRSTNTGLQNNSGTFTNKAAITIGANAPAGVYGISNSSSFDNLGGEINIDDVGATGILNGGNGFFTNQAEINIGAVKTIGVYGIYNGRNFTNGIDGEININDTGDDGIRNENSNASFTNQGKINIGANKAIGGQGVNNNDTANFANEASGEINIDDTGGNGISNYASTFTNQGKINIGANKAIGGQGVNNNDTANFANEASGEINIDRSNGGLFNRSGTTFTNSATINIGQNGGNIGNHGIESRNANTSFINDGGIIKIDNIGYNNPDADGILASISGLFQNTNGGQVLIGQLNGNLPSEGIASVTNGKIENNNSTITIDNAGGHGIVLVSGGKFDNLNGGQIDIGQNDGNIGDNGIIVVLFVGTVFTNDAGHIKIDNVGSDGVEVGTDGLFQNLNGGQIDIGQNGGNIGAYGIYQLGGGSFTNSAGMVNIDNTAFSALRNASGTFTNSSNLNIGQNGGPGNHANGIFNQSTFIHNGGIINIDNSQFQGILNPSGMFTSNATINIGQNGGPGNIGAYGIFNEATFDNNACALLTVFAPVNNSSAITNAGLFTINTAGAHTNTGTFTNNGVLETIQLPEVPNVTNNDLIVAPITGDCAIMPALQIGGANDFTATSEWFTDMNMTNKAGDYALNTFTVTNLGEGQHTLYFSASGNGCTFPLSIQVDYDDVTMPVPVCKNPTVQLDASGNYSLTENDVFDGGTDLCGTVNFVSMTPTSVSCADVWINNPVAVTVTANDGNGNENTCTALVTVEDNIAPTITCAAVFNPYGTDAGVCTYTVTGTALDVVATNDNCTVVSITNDFNAAEPWTLQGATFPKGTTTVVWTATDQSGHSGQCSYDVIVTDDEPQAIVDCGPDQTVLTSSVPGTCSGVLGDYRGGVQYTDNCPGVTVYQTPAPGSIVDVPHASTTTVTLATVDCGRFVRSCTITVTLVDDTAPAINCSTDIVNPYQTDAGTCTYTVPGTALDPTSATDNCTAVVSNDFSNSATLQGAAFPPGTTTVVWTVSDDAGNMKDCSYQIEVTDNEAPVAICPTTIADVVLDANCNGSLPADIGVGLSTDNCSATETSPAMDFNCSAGPQMVTLTVTDGFNTVTANCSFNVVDNQAPVAHCPANIPDVLLDASGNGSLPANIGDGSSTDNCSATETSPAMAFNCSAGPQTVTLTVTDGFNTVTTNCSFNVVDNQAPVAHCPSIPDVQLDASGNGSLPANIGDGSSTDNCTATETSPAISFTCADVDIQTVVLTASDGTNNSTINCSFNVVDNVLPTANCVLQTIQATLDATAQYTVDPNQLNENSSDACGILSLAASPAVLDCQHEGTNTVTLTITDNHGNTATCNATIEVAEFLTLGLPVATGESCVGAGDGTVSLSATAGGGQVKYSIDGGATFQPSGTFGNLSPGTYTIVVKVFGVPAVCEKTATVTVAAGGSPTTWFKDSDGDGYTDGTAQTSCAQPTGYINNPLPGTDCNDYDPLEFPGQTWYEDLDGDGYGSGVWLTACQRPAGCFLATEVAATDTDCNDNEATVFPLAAEVCDGLDNDCDGETDEGLTGTYVGNVLFTTQAQLDAWLACYDVIQGSVTIQGGNITDLTPLSNIVEITGNLMILMNTVLTSLDGLENLVDVGGAFYLYYNFQLSDCCAIDDLLTAGGVSGPVLIFFNAAGSHCNSAAAIMAACPVAPLVGSGSSNSFVQACSDCIPQGLMTVFPNPTSTTVNVKWSGENPSGTVQLTDLLGRVLMEHKLQSRNEFNVSKLGSGIYLVRVKVDGYKQQVERVVVDR